MISKNFKHGLKFYLSEKKFIYKDLSWNSILLKDKLNYIKLFEFIGTKINLNQAASNIVDRKELLRAIPNEGRTFIGRREQEQEIYRR